MMKRFREAFISDAFILSVIVLNALTLFALGYVKTGGWHHFLERLDLLFTLIFVVEATLKITTWSAKTYFEDNWNRFDFTLVLISLPHILAIFFAFELQELGYLLVFRLLRVFRIMRLIKFVPNINKIISGAQRAIKASSIIILVFEVVNFIFGIIAYQLFHEVNPEFFPDPLISMYSIFKVFTVEGWYEIPDTIAEATEPLYGMLTRFFFVFILFVGGIFGLSLVNSIFVDNMVADNNDELEAKIDELKEMILELKQQQSTK